MQQVAAYGGNRGGVPHPDDQVLVHYRGWSQKWDRWLDRRSPCIQPRHAKVRQWRRFKLRQPLEVRRDFRPAADGGDGALAAEAAVAADPTAVLPPSAAAAAEDSDDCNDRNGYVSKWFQAEVVDVDYVNDNGGDDCDEPDPEAEDEAGSEEDPAKISDPKKAALAKARAKAKAKARAKAAAKAKARARVKAKAALLERLRAGDGMEGYSCTRIKVALLSSKEGGEAKRLGEWFSAQSERLCDVETHVQQSKAGGKDGKDAAGGGSAKDRHKRGSKDVARGKTPCPGACGLMNIGNTCFMASMLQCLSNMEPLARYFLDQDLRVSERVREEINEANPLGCGGNLALSFAALLEDMWCSKFTTVAPRELKQVVGQKAGQFAGFQQQDSQEFLAFLADGLHEDLNRVRKKPVTRPIEARGRDDRVVAEESWEVFGRRNQSVIVDLLFGQLKSHLSCVSCGFTSVTFDPFSALSVPLPTQNQRVLDVLFVPLGGAVRQRLRCSVLRSGTVANLKAAICKAVQQLSREIGYFEIEPACLVMALTMRHRIFRLVGDSAPLFELRGTDDVVAYQVLAAAKAADAADDASAAMDAAVRGSLSASAAMDAALRGSGHGDGVVLAELLTRVHYARVEGHSCAYTPDRSCRDAHLVGHSLLLSLPGRGMTCTELHEHVWAQTCHLLLPGSGFSEREPPYRLLVTNASGTDDGEAVPRSGLALASIMSLGGASSSSSSAGGAGAGAGAGAGGPSKNECSRGSARCALVVEWAQADFEKAFDTLRAQKVVTQAVADAEEEEKEKEKGADGNLLLTDCLNQFTSEEKVRALPPAPLRKCRSGLRRR